MNVKLSLPSAMFALAGLVALGGCADESPQSGGKADTKGGAHAGPGDEHAASAGTHHDHPAEGPHGGSLVELGGEEYHAELLHDEKAGPVTIYVLDGSAKLAVPIEAKEVTINLKADGKREQVRLQADPDSTDPEGKSSRFTSTDARLAALDAEGANARLVLTINGKSYNGDLAHSHDHSGHAHGK